MSVKYPKEWPGVKSRRGTNIWELAEAETAFYFEGKPFVRAVCIVGCCGMKGGEVSNINLDCFIPLTSTAREMIALAKAAM